MHQSCYDLSLSSCTHAQAASAVDSTDTFEVLEPWRKNISQTEIEDEGEAKHRRVHRGLEVEHVYGFGGSKLSSKVFSLSRENCVFYFVGATGVVLNYVTSQQLILQETSQRITCAALHPCGSIIATGHELKIGDEKPSIIIWTLLHDIQYSRRMIHVKDWSSIDRKLITGQVVSVLALEFGRNGLDIIVVFLISGFQYLIVFDLEQEPIQLKNFACLGINKISSIVVHPHQDLIFVCGHNRLETWTYVCTADSSLLLDIINLELEILQQIHSRKDHKFTDGDIQPAYELLCDLVTLADDASQDNNFPLAFQAYMLASSVTSYIKDFVVNADLLQWQTLFDTFKTFQQSFAFLCNHFKSKLKESTFPTRGISHSTYFRWSLNAIFRIMHSYEEVHLQTSMRMKLRDVSTFAFQIDECYKQNKMVCLQQYSETINGKRHWKWNEGFPLSGQVKMQTIFCVAVCGVDEFVTGMEDGNIYVWKGSQIVDVCKMHDETVVEMSLTWDREVSNVHYLTSSGSDGSIVFSMWKRHEDENNRVSFSVSKVHEQSLPRLYQNQVSQYGVAVSNFPGVMKSNGFDFMDQSRKEFEASPRVVLIGTNHNFLYKYQAGSSDLILLMSAPSHGSVLTLSVCPLDDNMFLSGSDDGVAALWNVADRKCSKRAKYNSSILSSCFSGDGGRCVIGLADGNVVVIDIATFTDLQHVTAESEVTIISTSNGGSRLLLDGFSWTEKETKLMSSVNSKKNEIARLVEIEKESRGEGRVSDRKKSLQQEKLKIEILDLESEFSKNRKNRICQGILHDDNKSSIRRRRLYIAEMDILSSNGMILESHKKELLFEKQLSMKIEHRRIVDVHFKYGSDSVEVDLDARFTRKLAKGNRFTFQKLSPALKCGKRVISLKYSPNDQMLALSTCDNFVHVRRSYNLAEKFMKLSGPTGSVLHMDWSCDSKYIRANSANKELLFWGIHYSNFLPVSSTSKRGGEIPPSVKWASYTCTMEHSVLDLVTDDDGSNDRTAVRADRSLLFKDLLCHSSGSQVVLCRFPCVTRDPHRMSYRCHTDRVNALSFLGNHLLTCCQNEGSVIQWKIVQKRIEDIKVEVELPLGPEKDLALVSSAYEKERSQPDEVDEFWQGDVDSEPFVYRSQSLRVRSLHGRRNTFSTRVFVVCTGEYLWVHRSIAVLSDMRDNSQRHFLEHGDDEIVSINVDATRQKACTFSVRTKRAIFIWDVISFEVYKQILIDSLFQVRIDEIQFVPKSCDIALVGHGKKSFLFILSYESEAITGRFTFTEFLDHLVFDPFAKAHSPEFTTFGIGLPDFVRMARAGEDSWRFSVTLAEAPGVTSTPAITCGAYVEHQKLLLGSSQGDVFEFQFGRLFRVYQMHKSSISSIIVHNTYDQDSCILSCESNGLSKIWHHQTRREIKFLVPIVSDLITLDMVAMDAGDSLETLRHKLTFPTSVYGNIPALKNKSFYFICDDRQVHLSEEANICIKHASNLRVNLEASHPSNEKAANLDCCFDFFDQNVLFQSNCGSLFVLRGWEKFELGLKVCQGVPCQQIVSVCCNPAFPWFLTATKGGFVQKWDCRSLTCIDFSHLHSPVCSTDISPSGHHVAVATARRCLILDSQLQVVHQIEFSTRRTALSFLRYSPDGNKLAVGTRSGAIDMFDTHGHVAFARWAEELFKFPIDFDCVHWDFADGVLLAYLIEACCQPHARSSNLRQLRRYALFTDRPPLKNAYANRPQLRRQSVMLVDEALEYAVESLQDIRHHVLETFSQSFPPSSLKGMWKSELEAFLSQKLGYIDKLAQFKTEDLVGKVDASTLLQLFQCLKCIGTSDIQQARSLVDEAKKTSKEIDKLQGELNISQHKCEVSKSRKERFNEQVEALEAFKLRKTHQMHERLAELEETYEANVRQREALQKSLDGLRNEEAKLLVELLKLNEPSHVYLGTCQDPARADEPVVSLDWMLDNECIQVCHDRSLHSCVWNTKSMKLVRSSQDLPANFHSHSAPVGPAVSSIQTSSHVVFKTMAMEQGKLAVADGEGRLLLTTFPVADHRGLLIVMNEEFERDVGYDRVTKHFEQGLLDDIAQLLRVSPRRIRLWSHTSPRVFNVMFLQEVSQSDAADRSVSAIFLLSRLQTLAEYRDVLDKLPFLRYCEHVEGPLLVSKSMHGSAISAISFARPPGTIVTAGETDSAIFVWKLADREEDEEGTEAQLIQQILRCAQTMDKRLLLPSLRAARDFLASISLNQTDSKMDRLWKAYNRLSVVEIKYGEQILAERGIAFEGLFERSDLLQRLLQVVQDPDTMTVSEMKFELSALGIGVDQFFEREDLIAQILKARQEISAEENDDEDEFQTSTGDEDEFDGLSKSITRGIESALKRSSVSKRFLGLHTLMTCNQREIRRVVQGGNPSDRHGIPLTRGKEQTCIEPRDLVKGGKLYEIVSDFLGTSIVPGEVYKIQGYGESLFQYERYDPYGNFSDRLLQVQPAGVTTKVVTISRKDLLRWGRVCHGVAERNIFRSSGVKQQTLQEQEGGETLATGFIFKTFVDSPRPYSKRVVETVAPSLFAGESGLVGHVSAVELTGMGGCLEDYDFVPRAALETFLVRARDSLEGVCAQTRSKSEAQKLCDLIFASSAFSLAADRLNVKGAGGGELLPRGLQPQQDHRVPGELRAAALTLRRRQLRVLKLTGAMRIGFIDALAIGTCTFARLLLPLTSLQPGSGTATGCWPTSRATSSTKSLACGSTELGPRAAADAVGSRGGGERLTAGRGEGEGRDLGRTGSVRRTGHDDAGRSVNRWGRSAEGGGR
eukprot:749129-Hanusia_phi.AAC.2